MLPSAAQAMPGVEPSHEVEVFLNQFNIQPHAKDLLRTRPACVQQMILRRSMQGAKNTTAVMMKSLKGQPHDVEAFVRTYAIAHHTANRLRSLPQELQQEAMKTSLTSADDPTACLKIRIEHISS